MKIAQDKKWEMIVMNVHENLVGDETGMILTNVEVGDVDKLKFDMYWRAFDSTRAMSCWISSFRSRSSLEKK